MTFDFTHGKKANYMVMYYGNGGYAVDKCYYHTYKEAQEGFIKALNRGPEEGTAISIYDMNKDVRKAYMKF